RGHRRGGGGLGAGAPALRRAQSVRDRRPQGDARRRARGPADAVLATGVTSYKPVCAVSNDGRQLAWRDTRDRVHLVSLPDGRALAERPGKGVRNLLFSRHGLILVRQGWIDSLGAPEGDFAVPLGEPAFTLDYTAAPGGSAVSLDGELVVISRLGSNRADVV